MTTENNLKKILSRIDGKGFKAYKDLEGSYDFPRFTLHIDHIQGDPFAAPSRIRLRVSMEETGISPDLFSNHVRIVALEDFLVRRVDLAIKGVTRGRRGSGKSGIIYIDMGGQEVIERTAAKITSGWVEVRIYVGMPAMSRRVLARQAGAMLCDELPRIVEFSLLKENFSRKDAQYFVDSIENQEYIQSRLDAMGLIAFVADGAVLPRESGNSQKPLVGEKAVPFSSPDSLRIEITLPHSLSMISDGKRTITGMGIPKGITLIVGGGYHGKSTLLQALQRGVYPHIPGDGREYVITAKNSVKIRAEEGRRVEQVDISPFINNLPHGIDTHSFSTDNASGSTSQAANIIEALETGTAVLLLDEDTSATNFMVRDMRMQHMVAKRFEPIIPFVDRVREIYQTFHVSTILVMGGCGDYFDSADTVIMMREYLPFDATAEAKKIAADYPTNRSKESEKCRSWNLRRIPVAESFDPSRGGKAVKIDTKAVDQILFGTEMIDLRGVEQLIDASQTRAIGAMIHLASARFMDGGKSFSEILKNIENFLDENGLDVLDPFYRREKHPGSFARPRRHEIAAAVNRLRTLRMRPLKFVS